MLFGQRRSVAKGQVSILGCKLLPLIKGNNGNLILINSNGGM